MHNSVVISKKVYVLGILLLILFDQYSKILASFHLSYTEALPIINGFKLQLANNTGAAFSFLSEQNGWQRWFFIILASGMSLYIANLIQKIRDNQVFLQIGLSLILAGALGNLWDRVMFGYVIDFISVYYKEWHWPTFNIADLSISIGAIMVSIKSFKSKGNIINYTKFESN